MVTSWIYDTSQVQKDYVEHYHNEEVWETDHEGFRVSGHSLLEEEGWLCFISDWVDPYDSLELLSHVIILVDCSMVIPLNEQAPTSAFPEDHKECCP